jgi:hypothetical protein
VDSRLFGLWEEVVCLAESLELSSEDDEPIWQFQSSGFTHPPCMLLSILEGLPLYMSLLFGKLWCLLESIYSCSCCLRISY